MSVYQVADPNLVVEDASIGFEPPFMGRENRAVGESVLTTVSTAFLIKNRSWKGGGFVRDIHFVPRSLSGAVNPRMRLIDLDRRHFGPYEKRLIAFEAYLSVPAEVLRDSILVEIKLVDQDGAHMVVADVDTLFHPLFSAVIRTHRP